MSGHHDFWECLDRHIARALGAPFAAERREAVAGGCINRAYRLQGSAQTLFVKLHDARPAGMFAAEAEALAALAAAATVRVPRPLCHGEAGGTAYLVMEHLALGAPRPADWAALGRELAALHAIRQPRFGWGRDNTIGSTPQPNPPTGDWVGFFRRHRLGHQLALARRNGHDGALWERGQRLLEGLDAFFAGHAPWPSLLHGDLWVGNVAGLRGGGCVLFDPASYHGDREADLAMTALFGGFPGVFHAAYREALPLDAGHEVRRELYNLYHVLNHLNLFGGGYAAQARRMIDALLAQLA